MSVLNEYMNSTQRDILQHTGIHHRTIDDVIERIEDRRAKERNSERVKPTVIPQAPVVSQEIAKKQSGIHELAQQVKEDADREIDFGDLLSGLTVDDDEDDASSDEAEGEELSHEDVDFAEIQRIIDGQSSPSRKMPTVTVDTNKKPAKVSDEEDDFADIQRMIDEQSALAPSRDMSRDFGDLLKGLKKTK